jgi:hypothetical protein
VIVFGKEAAQRFALDPAVLRIFAVRLFANGGRLHVLFGGFFGLEGFTATNTSGI